MKEKPCIFLRYFVLNPSHGLVFFFEVPVHTNVLRVSQWYNLLLPWSIPSPYRRLYFDNFFSNKNHIFMIMVRYGTCLLPVLLIWKELTSKNKKGVNNSMGKQLHANKYDFLTTSVTIHLFTIIFKYLIVSGTSSPAWATRRILKKKIHRGRYTTITYIIYIFFEEWNLWNKNMSTKWFIRSSTISGTDTGTGTSTVP